MLRLLDDHTAHFIHSVLPLRRAEVRNKNLRLTSCSDQPQGAPMHGIEETRRSSVTARSRVRFVLVSLVLVASACGGSTSSASPKTPAKREAPAAKAATTTTPPPPGSTPAAKEAAAKVQGQDPAAEVCSSMTQKNVANQLASGTIKGTPKATKSGNVTACDYTIGDGRLVMSVHEEATNAAAEGLFAKMRQEGGAITQVRLLGTDAFTQADGSTVTLKDAKVLVVDTSRLPVGNDRKQISQSLSFQILACWTD